MDITLIKLKWLIEHFTSNISFKNQIKKMMGHLLDIASQTKDQKNLMKNVGHLNVMLKHCEIKDIHPYLTETIYSAFVPKEK